MWLGRLKMKLVVVILKLTVFLILSYPTYAFQVDEDLEKNITNLIKPNWPYEAFLAIPRISEIRPTLAIEISGEDRSQLSYECVELFYFDLKKEFEPKAKLERKSLHELLCKAMKRAVKGIPDGLLLKNLNDSQNIALSFNFFNGLINIIEIPYPPLNPILNLENVFLDRLDSLIFGGLDFPEELDLEINQTPL